MDENKRAKLKEIQYTIPPICGSCIHSNFEFDAADQSWGTCKKFTYEHLKHTDSVRQLSIYRYGSCLSFEKDSTKEAFLGPFTEFVQT